MARKSLSAQEWCERESASRNNMPDDLHHMLIGDRLPLTLPELRASLPIKPKYYGRLFDIYGGVLQSLFDRIDELEKQINP